MKCILGIMLTAVSITTFADGVVYDGEFYADTKRSASSSTPYVHPTNVVSIADKRIANFWDNFFKPTYLPGALYAINLYNSTTYPSAVYGRYNINLGIDNEVGDKSSTDPGKSAYSTAIGTSAKALGMHSYAYGSQINAVKSNTTVIGYGASATSEWSTVIGHGKRPYTGGSLYDKNFNTTDEMNTWLRTFSDDVFRGVHFLSPDGTLYTITGVRDSVDSQGYWYDFVTTPGDEWDYIPGGYDWRYGKSHGPGTFNIVAYSSSWKRSPGLRAVYINDDCLADLVFQAAAGTKMGAPLTSAQVNNGVSYISNGYEEDGAVQIGKDAVGSISDEAVAAVTTKNTKLRNVGVAIGTRAVAEGSSAIKNQSIAIGYCAKASGSNAIAIGGGSRHFDDETDDNGGNAYAKGSNTIAMGYSAKALATDAVAIGTNARSEETGAVQIGKGTNNEPNTLKFQDVVIVKDGKIKGFDDTSLDPKQIDLTSATNIGEVLKFSVNPHVINTIDSSTPLTPDTKYGVTSTGTRNYEVFIANTENVRVGLPINMHFELPDGVRYTIVNGINQAHKLPAKITIKQPHASFVLAELTEYDDGHDWSPIITKANLLWKDGKIVSNGFKLLEGTNLHSGVSLKYAYPISTGDIVTNEVAIAKDNEIISDTFYHYIYTSDFTPPSDQVPSPSGGTTAPITIIYETKCGKKPCVFTTDLEMISL